jgi:quercetin dioxygenase-like cupin family protein
MDEHPERMIQDHMRQLGIEDLDDLILDMSEYQVFTDDAATVVLSPRGKVVGGIVVWNLLPSQENDYHMHPESEHLMTVIEGELEFTLGTRPPEVVKPGQMVVVPPTLPHGIRNVSDRRGSYVAVTNGGSYQKIPCERPVFD